MNEFDPEQIEAELRRLRSAQMPVGARARLLAALASSSSSRRRSFTRRSYLPWLIPAAAVAALALIVFEHAALFSKQQTRTTLASAVSPLTADKVEIDRQLLAHFDAVGRLPDGQAVRFHCAQWVDNVRLRDSAAGLLIERSSPRLEIVPVGFETY